MKKWFLLLLLTSSTWASVAQVYNSCTGCQDYVSSGGGGSATLPLPPGDTNYIQNTSILQSNATFYVSSGTASALSMSTGTVIGSSSTLSFTTIMATSSYTFKGGNG